MNRYSYTLEEVKGMLPFRSDHAHKGSCGKLLLVAGSKNMAGAAFLSAKAALRGGAGLVYIYTPEENRVILQQLIPEAVLYTYPDGCASAQEVRELMQGKQAVAMGPGIGRNPALKKVLEEILQGPLPVVLDADGLNLLSEEMHLLKKRKCPLVITPHPAEMARLLGCGIRDVVDKKEEIALSTAKDYQMITVLKDHHTAVSDGKDLYVNQTGNHGMATAGSGDVLTGVIGSLLAQGMDHYQAAKAGVFLHGHAGDIAAGIFGKRSLMAGDIADYICRGMD